MAFSVVGWLRKVYFECGCICVRVLLVLMNCVGSVQFWCKHQQKNGESPREKEIGSF